MQIKDLIPWGRDRRSAVRRGEESDNPLSTLQRDINRVFDDFWSRFDRPFGAANGWLGASMPRTDISETDEEVEIAVDLPGLDEKDIEVNLTDDVLTIHGEKKAEKEEKKKGYYLSERSYGAFHRMIPLPPGVDTGKAEASFKRGVLRVSLPKTSEARAKVKRIEVKSA
ncbi:MAG: Hsp20/alpha crystallin family protein [Alphaproteobacteria bacterium]|nr:MAG: Hsp20/alpha crystallin family protein [Alphaproteobacteria bacterium]